MSTPKNYDADLQTVKEVLKRAGKSNVEIEVIINQIKDKPEILEKLFSDTFQIIKPFVIKYPKNATEEEKQRLFVKALKKQQTKQSLAESTEKATL